MIGVFMFLIILGNCKPESILDAKSGAEKHLLWQSNKAGLFSQFLQLKLISQYAQHYDRILLSAPINSTHFSNLTIRLCDIFILPTKLVTCADIAYVPR